MKVYYYPNKWTVLDPLLFTSEEKKLENQFWSRGIFLSDAIQAVIDMRHGG